MNRIFALVIFLFPLFAAAQQSEGAALAERFERIQEVKQEFLTRQLELTPTEAAAFFPLYWEQERLARAARRGNGDRERGKRNGISETDISESEARNLLTQRIERLRNRLEHEEAAQTKYLKVIPATKLIKLEAAEAAFRRKLLERSREAIRQRRN